MKTLWAVSYSVITITLISASSIRASDDTIGMNGINSVGLRLATGSLLTGNNIAVGQVEPFRPGDPNQPNGMPFDTSGSLINTSVNPAEVFFARFASPGMPSGAVTFTPTMNDPNGDEIDSHAVEVAGVIISTDTKPPGTPQARGVATGAELYSIGDNSTSDFEEASSLTSQQIVLENGGDIRAVNMSFAVALSSPHVLDGNSLLTQFVDWSASAHDTLYICAGNQLDSMGMPDGLSLPTDNFNGITVAASEKMGGVYRRVWSDNNLASSVDAVGVRTSVDIVAPGTGVLVTSQSSTNVTGDGTSYAAPHVTGTVALLQEYGDQRISASAAGWGGSVASGPTAHRHEVMKAVLMNSADKLIDNGTVIVPGGLPIPAGGLLGMERTVVKQNGTSTWFNSISWDDSVDSSTGGDFPLDEQMGSGHLNARRALQQFAAGEHEEFGVNGTRVPVVGWDYGTTTGENDNNRYRFNQELEAGSFVAITLAWDREVEFDTDGGTPGQYDIGDTFVEYDDTGFFPDDDVINDLDLYFQPAFAGTISQARAYSASGVGTVEHIFFQVETTGEYEFWVRQEDEDVGVTQNYAVAWWALGTGPLLAGDFDGDDDVDGDDLAQWEDDYGLNASSDADGDGDSDGIDFLAWQRNFGTGVLSAATAVPEPGAGMLGLMGMVVALRRRGLGA